MRKTCLIIVMAAALCGCGPEQPVPAPEDRAHGASAGETWRVVLLDGEHEIGSVTLEFEGSAAGTAVRGVWRSALAPDVEGLAVLESGRFEGEVRQDVFTINLHPEVVDNNIELTIGANGGWRYLTDAGITREGAIEVNEKR